MNSWQFVGNLGKDCEKRYLSDQTAVTSFSVGVTSGYGDKAVTTWANCNLWGKQAESLAPYLHKGQKVAISGEVTLRKYTTKEGVERESLDVRVNSLTLVGSKDATTARENAPKRDSVQTRGDLSDISEDIPFDNPYKGRKSYVV